MKRSYFAGTGTILRLLLRRDRFLLPVWVLLPLLVTLGQVKFVMALPDWQKFIVELSANPLTGGLLGPVVPLSLAGAIIWRSSIQGAMIVAVGSLLTVIRHTRTEEETGRSELIRGGMVSRHANLTAVVLGLAAGLGWGLTTGDVGSVLPRVLVMSMSKIPVVWIMVGITAMFYGLLPRAVSILSWCLLGLFVAIEMAWEAQMVDWSVMRLVPFSYVHYTIPVSELPILLLVWLACLAVVFTFIGLLGFRRRSIM